MSGLSAVQMWKDWARWLKLEAYVLYLAYKDPRVPWYTRLFAAVVVAYAFSPIDLVPDPIPILGYLDDLLLVPLGAALALRMIPREVLIESRQRAREMMAEGKPTPRAAVVVIVATWLLLLAVMMALGVGWFWGWVQLD